MISFWFIYIVIAIFVLGFYVAMSTFIRNITALDVIKILAVSIFWPIALAWIVISVWIES